MKQQNEINAANAISQIIKQITDIKYTVLESPDEKTSKSKEVDYIFYGDTVEAPMLAMEHTVIELYDGQIEYAISSYDIVSYISEKCSGRLPSDRYYFIVITNALTIFLKNCKRRKKALSDFVENISKDIIEIAPKIGKDNNINLKYMNYDVLLYCGGFHSEKNGTIGRILGRVRPSYALACKRISRSMFHGIDKFFKYKKLEYDTVLSLQDVSGEAFQTIKNYIKTDENIRKAITKAIDYIIIYKSLGDYFIDASVLKFKDFICDEKPLFIKFENVDGRWIKI